MQYMDKKYNIGDTTIYAIKIIYFHPITMIVLLIFLSIVGVLVGVLDLITLIDF